MLTTRLDRRKIVRLFTFRDRRCAIWDRDGERESAFDRRQRVNFPFRNHERLMPGVKSGVIESIGIPEGPAAARALPEFFARGPVFLVYDNPMLKEREHDNVAVDVRDHALVRLSTSGIDLVTNGRFRADVATLERLDAERTKCFHENFLRLSMRSDCIPTSRDRP